MYKEIKSKWLMLKFSWEHEIVKPLQYPIFHENS